jgi:hypothetical protein
LWWMPQFLFWSSSLYIFFCPPFPLSRIRVCSYVSEEA